MIQGAGTSAYRNVIPGERYRGISRDACRIGWGIPSLRLAWYSAIASVRTQWLHLPPDRRSD